VDQVICRAEKLNVTPDALTALAEATNNDIRSCLNTLQFIK
jgi:DNA polymerase III delta prime subunit